MAEILPKRCKNTIQSINQFNEKNIDKGYNNNNDDNQTDNVNREVRKAK